jgi:hypothetical protein
MPRFWVPISLIFQITNLEGNIRNNYSKKIRDCAAKIYEQVGLTEDFQKVQEWQTLIKQLDIENCPAALAWAVIVVDSLSFNF